MLHNICSFLGDFKCRSKYLYVLRIYTQPNSRRTYLQQYNNNTITQVYVITRNYIIHNNTSGKHGNDEESVTK